MAAKAVSRPLVMVFLWSCLLSLSGCLATSLQAQRVASARLATDVGWHRLNLSAGKFVLAAFAPSNLLKADTLSIYIEGDGLAWVNSSMPSFDPTPLNPVALRLALKHRGPAVYLGRPCQYVAEQNRPGCEIRYWTGHRFSPEVIEASNNAITQLKNQFGANKIELIGYSGGGAVAALVAARRFDVARLITVAGNLDHSAWTRIHQISPLSGSLNPADEWQNLIGIPQAHFVGGQDRNIPVATVNSYLARYPKSKRPALRVIDNFNHDCCWAEKWPALYIELDVK